MITKTKGDSCRPSRTPPVTSCNPPIGPGVNFNGLVINNFTSVVMTQTKSTSCRPAPGLRQRPPAWLLQGSTRNILQASYRTRCEHVRIDHNFNGLVINNFISLVMTQTKSTSCRPTPGLHQRPPPAGLLQGSTRNILQTFLKDQV